MSLSNNKSLLLFLAVLCIFILIPTAFAGEFDENQTVDTLSADDSAINSIVTADNNVIYVSPTAGGDGDGSEDNPYNLTQAVKNYDSESNSKIIMKNGEYKITEQINLNKDITIEGESYNGVILNAEGETAILKATGSNIVLSNLKFINGYVERSYSNDYASGLQISYGAKQVDVNNCIFENNSNAGLSTHASNVIVNIANSVFDSNYVKYDWSANGAAIYHAGSNAVMNIVNTTFKNNYVDVPQTSSSKGGAIYGAMNFKSLLVDNCLFINNSAEVGSAIASYCGGNISVFNTQFINQTQSVIWDSQANSAYLTLFTKNLTFDEESGDNIVISGKVNLVSLENNDRISGNNIKMNYGDDENYTVTLTDADGNPLPSKEIIITLTNYYNAVTTLTGITNANGQVTFSMKNQTPGKYKVLSSFAGDDDYDTVNATNAIEIRSDSIVSIVIIPDYVKIKEGESYVVTGYITDSYYEPNNKLSGASVTVEFSNPTKHSLTNAAHVSGTSFTFDVAQCSLKTSDEPYIITFSVDPGIYEGYVNEVVGYLTVDLSVDLPDVEDMDIIYVSADGSDVDGNGSKDNPLASVQLALNLNKQLGGGKTIIVGEGTYDIANFNIMDDVTIIGEKNKTIFRQPSGKQGMFKLMNSQITVDFINLTFTDGYTTPMPYSLITAYGEGVKVNIDGCEFKNNTCLNGAAIAISHGASVYVNNSRFIDNEAIMIQSTAGAIFVLEGYLSVANTEFINNTACDGGAIWIGYAGVADITDSTFTDNIAYNTTVVLGGGGAIYTKGTTTIKNSTFTNNYADLYGGAIYIAGGNTLITKSYFENNTVGPSYDGSIKGSIIESEPWTDFVFKLEYSILLTNDERNYMALFSNNEEASIELNTNYWGSNTWSSYNYNTNVPVYDHAIIQIRPGTEPVYRDDNTSVYVEFKNHDIYDNTISEMGGLMHDYTVDISSTLNSLNSTHVTIVNNRGQDEYYPAKTGLETVTVNDASAQFTVVSSDKANANANVTVNPGNTTTITVEVPTDLQNNVSIKIKNREYSREAGNGIIVLTLETDPGTYDVIVSYGEDDNYKGFSITESFTIPKYKSALTVHVDDIVDGQAAFVEINITEGAAGNLVIVLNGYYRINANIDGATTIKDIYDLPAGNYTVDVIYEGNDYYEGSTASTTFEVSEREIIVVPDEPVDGYAYIYVQTGSETTLTIYVPANLTNVSIKVNEDEYIRDSGNGRIILTVPTDEAGEYAVIVSFNGNDKYNPFEAAKGFTIYDYCWFINETGYRTLREAVDAAGEGDVIKGNITEYVMESEIDVGHRYMPSENWTVIKNITITSMNSDKPVTIKGTSSRLFFVDSNSHLTLNNLILEGSDIGDSDGGAVETMYDAYVTITNCTFANFTASRGGALFLWGQSWVKDSTFINNNGNIGGAIFILSPMTNDNNVILDNITVINNNALSYGAGIYISGSFSNKTIIKNSNFTNNTGHGRGGAIYAEYGNVIIDNSVFDSNRALAYDGYDFDGGLSGGAIFVSRYCDANITNTQLINNYADEYAGAIACDNVKTGIQDLTTGEEIWTYHYTNMDNCSFTNNTAGVSGGAIYIGLYGIATVNIYNSIFDANKAPEAAAISSNYAFLLIDNTEFTNNIAENASLITAYGVYTDDVFDATTTILGSTFANNTVAYDINQLTSYTNLLLQDSTFDDDAVILINKGSADLYNNVQTKDNANYAVINNNELELSKNTFINPIDNEGYITSQTYIIILDNETKDVPVNTPYTLKAIVCDDNNNIIEKGDLKFLIDGMEIPATYTNFEYSANYNVTEGNHTVNANYNGSRLNKLSVKTATLVAKNQTELKVTADAIKVGDDAVITVNIPENATGNIIIKINNKTYELSIKDGAAKLTVSNLTAGEYAVEISYAGDKIYAPNETNITVKVDKISDYVLDISVSNITSDSAVININAPNDFNENITVTIDGVNQTVEVKNGKATIPLTNITIGNHNVEAKFDGNDKYTNNTAQNTFNLAKQESSIIININDVKIGEDAVITVTLPENATGDVIITVDGKDYPTTAKDGKATVSIPNLSLGEHSVEVLYLGDSLHLDATNSTKFNITNSTVNNTITVKQTVIEVTVDGTTITGTLKDAEGKPIANATVNYSIDGETGVKTTDANGEFTLDVSEGKTVKLQYAGDNVTGDALAVVKLNNVTVNVPSNATPVTPASRKDTVIVVDPNFTRVATDYDAGERGAFFYAVLKDSDGNVLSNKTVQIGVNGAIYNVTTDSLGRAGLQVNLVSANTYTYALSFQGDDEYNASPLASSRLIVTKKTLKITASNKAFKAKTKTKQITVKLTPSANKYDGKTYLKAGKKVTLKINGKTYSGKINSKGVVKFTIKLTKKGKFIAKIAYKGDKTYKAVSKKITVTIK